MHTQRGDHRMLVGADRASAARQVERAIGIGEGQLDRGWSVPAPMYSTFPTLARQNALMLSRAAASPRVPGDPPWARVVGALFSLQGDRPPRTRERLVSARSFFVTCAGTFKRRMLPAHPVDTPGEPDLISVYGVAARQRMSHTHVILVFRHLVLVEYMRKYAARCSVGPVNSSVELCKAYIDAQRSHKRPLVDGDPILSVPSDSNVPRGYSYATREAECPTPVCVLPEGSAPRDVFRAFDGREYHNEPIVDAADAVDDAQLTAVLTAAREERHVFKVVVPPDALLYAYEVLRSL